MKKLKIIRNSPEHDELIEFYRKEKNPKLKERYHALFLMHEFMNCPTVAKLAKKTRKTIQAVIKRFNQNRLKGTVQNMPSGRLSRLLLEQKKLLKADVLTRPLKLGFEFSDWEGKSTVQHIE
ncbi:MAG: hypothetical protein ACTSYC_11385 [Promethearchaeota archaeon]